MRPTLLTKKTSNFLLSSVFFTFFLPTSSSSHFFLSATPLLISCNVLTLCNWALLTSPLVLDHLAKTGSSFLRTSNHGEALQKEICCLLACIFPKACLFRGGIDWRKRIRIVGVRQKKILAIKNYPCFVFCWHFCLNAITVMLCP